MERVAIYPGSFDPVTNGHVDMVRRGLLAFDHVIVGVATNPAKKTLFSKPERVELIQKTFEDEPRVEVECFEGLLVSYMERRGVYTVIRGLRAVSDFEYEFQMVHMNRKLLPGMETFFMMAGEEHFYLSSQMVREVAMFGGDITTVVPPIVATRIREKYDGMK